MPPALCTTRPSHSCARLASRYQEARRHQNLAATVAHAGRWHTPHLHGSDALAQEIHVKPGAYRWLWSPLEGRLVFSVDRLPILSPPTSQRQPPPWRHIWRSLFSPRRQHPWVVLPGGFFLEDLPSELSDVWPEPIASFPENLRCVGSTGSWLALDRTAGEGRHAYFLHNPFSRATVPLPELDAVVGDVSELFTIRKVLMRSTPDDLIVVMTNNRDLPIFSVQRGKGVLLPQLETAPVDLGTIVDIAFLGDKLYGLTMDSLVSLPITFDDVHDIPMATSIEQVIWSDIDYADVVGNNDDEDDNNTDDEGDKKNIGEVENGNDELLLSEEDKAEQRNHIKLMLKARDGKVGPGFRCEADYMIFRYLVESYGKLFMVIREADSVRFTYKVELLVLDVNAPAWLPVSGGGLGGHTLFISKPFSKSVLARGEDSTSSTQFPAYADDTSRLIWNFLADRTSTWQATYVLPANSSDPMGAADPVWTESYWNTIGLRVYAVQCTTSDRLILLTGLAVTAASYLQLPSVRAERGFSRPSPPTSQHRPPWRRMWRSVSVVPPRRQQPWIVLPGGFFLDELASELSDRGPEAATSFPENLRCVGSTNSWLVLDWTDGEKRHAYFLHNPFSRATVPLPELDAVIGDVSELFMIRKRGKGAFLPQRLMYWGLIIDVAFLEDKLYGITKDEELVILPFTFEDVPSIPMATRIEQVIWSNIDDADAADDDEDEDGNNKGYVGDEQNNGEAEKDNDELLSKENKAGRPNHIMMLKARDGMIGPGIQFEADYMIFRYLVESCKKLFMVIREANGSRFTYKVKVFILDVNACEWVPISGCGLGGQTLFISKPFSKTVLARGEVEQDAIYFIDFGEVFSMKSSKATYIGQFREDKFLDFNTTTWIFPCTTTSCLFTRDIFFRKTIFALLCVHADGADFLLGSPPIQLCVFCLGVLRLCHIYTLYYVN
uniref:KIB1-4 beta-propeller domain-containing protein n=1 Tax=Aegilops tauschii TaxID=37682 RepID=M8B3M1_AEGTA